MTVANVNVTKVLLKRGNTAQNNNYTGVNGELTIDTQAATLRIHDGTTVGGTVITAGGVVGSYSNTNAAAYLASQNITSANIGGSQTFANANAAVQATAINSLNANIGAFQSYANLTLSTIANAASQESAINSINANVGAYQTFANANAATQATSINSINANIGAYQTFANANAASQTTEINSLRANITAANAAITGLQSNAAVQAALLDTLTGNAATQSQVLDTLTTNAATQATTLTTLLSNAVAQQTSLIDLVANAATQAQFISNTNANTKSYLAAFDGNIIPAANVTYSLGDSTHQWKDLWVSNNTIYISNTPVRVHNGTLLVNNTSIADTISKLTNGAYTFNLFANGQSRSPDTVFASNGVSILGANNTIQGGMYNSGDANFFNIGASTGRGFKFYVNEETDGPLFFANGSVNVPSNLYSAAGVIGDVGMYGGTIWHNDPNGNYLTLTHNIEGYAYIQLPSDATANVANLRIHNDIGNVEIATGDGISYHNWYFRNDGDLNLPTNGDINFNGGGIGQTINEDFTIRVQDQEDDGWSVIQIVDDGAGTTLGSTQLQRDAFRVQFAGGSQPQFRFADNGELQLPGNVRWDYPYINHNLYAVSDNNGEGSIELKTQSYSNDTLGTNIRASWTHASISTNNAQYNWVFDNSGSLTAPGNIISGSGAIQFVANSSGDGNGYATMRLIPDIDREFWDQYLIVDPTAPGHIHIRAGGTQDNSNADLILGGENSHVRVTAGSNPPVYIKANSASWAFGVDSSLSMPTGGNLYFDNSAVSVIDGVTNITASGTVGANVIQVLSDLTSFGASPAPVIYGFRSIATTGSAVNEGNISASGNLVASQNAYVTGNVFATRYNFANGVNILSTVGAGSYGNTQVAAYLPTYSGNASAARVQVTNALDFMYGGYPYMGWQLSGSDTLKLRTNIASGDYTNDAIIVDRQSLAVNVVATLTAGNIITANGLFWSNGVAYSTGGGASTGNVTFTDTTISTTGGAGQGIILNSAGAGEIAMLDYVGINNTNPGYWLHVGDGAPGAVNNTGNISIDYNNGLDSSRASTIIGYAWWDAGGNGNNNRGIGAHRQFGIYKNDDLYTTKYLEIDLTSGNANLTNIAVTKVTTTNGVFWANGLSVLNDLASQSYVTTQINNLVNNAPALLDTLGEIAANLATEANTVGSILNSISNTNANVTAANLNITTLQSNAGSQQTSIDILLNRVNQEVNNTSSPQFAGLTTTANVELTGNVHIHQNLVVDGNINFIGNVTQTNITTANAVFTGDTYGFGALYAGTLGYTPLPYTVIQATADYNDYSQINFQNLNLSANASTEWVATAGNGSDLTNYIDFGIAGGAWNGTQLNSVGTAAKANDGWVYVLGNTAAGTGGNLVLGTVQPNKRVNILTGGPNSANIYSYFDSNGLTTANVSATNYLYTNGVSILTGIGGAYSNTNVEAYIGGNIGAFQIFANANAATQATSINSINANIGSYQIFANANAATQATSINTINANLGSYQAYANATFSTSTYGNTQVAAYLPTYAGNIAANNITVSNTISAVSITTSGTSGNITGANYISANTFVFAANGVNILSAASGSGTDDVLRANVGAYQIFANANAATQATSINTINANLGAYQTFANANVSSIQNQIFASNANIGAFQTYANATFTGGGGSTYSNTNVAAYLTTATVTTTGNITAANLIATGNVYTSNIVTTGATSGNISGANYVSANVVQISSGLIWANGTAFTSGTTYTSSGAGNITVSGSTLSLTATGPAAVAVGSSTAIPVITPDGYGRIASLSTAAVVAPAGTLSGTTLAATVVTSSLTSVGTLGSLTVTGNVTAGNVSVTQVTATTGAYSGNVTAANIITTGTYGNITGANVISANTVTVTTFVRTQAVAFAALPSATAAGAGARAFITDGNSATFAAAVSGSGANAVPVYSNGTNWFVG